MRARPEILAPAGEPRCLEAAVAGGADAVYLGLRHFNARGRAANFRSDALPCHVDYLHHHGLRCYVVLNTLLHDDEFPKALRLAGSARAAGVDAFIVQDLGLWRALRSTVGEVGLHASTQMTVHCPEQIAVLAELGAERVILARELDHAGVAACTEAARALGVETEHFVHGALCYAYSGQCLISNFAGCRSANRGTCAQNCRYVYRDQRGREDTAFSMRDSALLGAVGELAELGVASLKIEGRLKGPDYVYTVSRVYRQAVDAWSAGRRLDEAALRERLAGVFSRGHGDAWWRGQHGPEARLSRHADGAPADALIVDGDRRQGRVVLQADRQPQPGQGFSWQEGSWSDGFLIIAVDAGARPGQWRCRVRMEAKGPPVRPGTPCFHNVDHERQREAEAAMATVRLEAHRDGGLACRGQLRLHVGAAAHAQLQCIDGRRVAGCSRDQVQAATARPLDEAAVRRSFATFGGSGFRLDELHIDCPEPAFLPMAELKALRRQLVAALAREPVPQPAWQVPPLLASAPRRTAIWAVVGSVAAADAALAAGAERVVLDDPLLDPRHPVGLEGLDPQVWLRQLPHAPVAPALVASGRGQLVGQLGQLRAAVAAGLPVAADHPLNLVNLESLRQLGQLGALAACISLECSTGEAARLNARRGDDPALPCVLLCVHGRLPAMYTISDHGLDPGQERSLTAHEREGGLPYQLCGRTGSGPVLYEARECCAPESAGRSAALVDGWLLELAHHRPEAVTALVRGYRALAAGDATAAGRIRRCTQDHARHGIFPGHLDIGSRALDQVLAGRPG